MVASVDLPRLQGRQTWLGVKQCLSFAMAPRFLPVGVLLTGGLALLPGPGHAGSATAESIFTREAARQRAMEQVPRGARVTRTVCSELEVRGDFRFRCSAYYTNEPSAPAASPP
jgi:hypothetical protein